MVPAFILNGLYFIYNNLNHVTRPLSIYIYILHLRATYKPFELRYGERSLIKHQSKQALVV